MLTNAQVKTKCLYCNAINYTVRVPVGKYMCTVYSVLNVYLRTTMEAYYICSTHIANIDTIE